MCLVEVEKMPKMMTACTLPVSEGMVVRTETEQVKQARKYTLEFLLTNHPLDCPVCDKGGECELQDMVFRYGAGESRYTEEKVHTPEKQFSPVVYFDAPRCILCFRCVRVCNEALGVGALGVVNRGVVSEIAPNVGDHLECDECGACIDICPVGALTSGTYRYQTRPWEMTHVGTICTHCGDGCKTTLGTRNDQIIRGNNRDRSGINGEFLCIKGRYAFDFYDHPERLQSPLMRVNGKLEEVSWAQALQAVAQKFTQTLADGGSFGVIGSNHTTNEENFYLQKFARQVLKTNHIDHHRTGDVVTLLDALSGKTSKLAKVSDLYERKAILVLGADLALEHPMLSYQIRANYRHHQAHVYVVTPQPVREDKYAAASRPSDRPPTCLESLRDKLKAEPELVILFDDSYQGEDLRKLVDFAESLGIPVKFVCLLDYANSRGAVDMGLTPELLPGYKPSGQPGMHLDEMIAAPLDVLWVVGANPLKGALPRKAALPRSAGHVPHRNRAAGRCRPAGGLRVRKGRYGHQHHGRSAAPHARHQHHGRQAGPRNHGLHRARNGRGGGARSLGGRNGLRGNPPDRTRIRYPHAGDRHRRCGADHAGQRAHSRGTPACSGAIRPQRPVRVRHARAVF